MTAETREPIAVTLECHGELQALCNGFEQPLQLGRDNHTVADAVAALADVYPQSRAALTRSAYAVGDSLVPGDRALQSGDTVALIPPVSGG